MRWSDPEKGWMATWLGYRKKHWLLRRMSPSYNKKSGHRVDNGPSLLEFQAFLLGCVTTGCDVVCQQAKLQDFASFKKSLADRVWLDGVHS